MAEFKLGRIRFIWKNNWATGGTYVKDDIVRYGGKTYVCVSGHTAAADFYTDLNNIPTHWNQVSDGSEWKGDWEVDTYYKVNDLVRYGGRVYLCNLGHHSNASANSGTSPDTTAGLEADFTKWDLYATGLDWKGDWATGTRYKIDDVVRYGALTYVCNTGHQSAATAATDSDGLEADLSKWDVYAKGFNWIGNWTTGYRYKKNDVVLYGGTTYVCNTGHQSAPTAALGLETDQSLWDYFHKGIVFLGYWTTGTRYKINDIVKQGSDLWICTVPHTSDVFLTDESNWSLFVNGLEFENSWSNSTTYQPGDIVGYGGYAYISTTNNLNKTPTSNLSDWDLFTTGFNFRGDWALATDYKVGDVIRLNGYTYVALIDQTSSSGNQPPNLTYWSRLNSGIKWNSTTQLFANVGGTNVIGSGTGAKFDVTLTNTKYTAVVHTGSAGSGYNNNDTIKITGDLIGGITPANDVILTVTASAGAVQSVTATGYSVTWATGTPYVLGDTVSFGVNTYICTLGHTSGSLSRPDNDVTGTYWNLLSAGSITSVLTTQGDTLYFGGAGPTRLPIGTDGQVLRVTGNAPSWAYYGVINNVVYVANSGADVSGNGQGLTIDKPWKTIRYAAKQIEDGYLNPQAASLIAKNKQFIIKEVNNYIQYTNAVSISAASTTLFTCTSTAGIYVGMPISFSGTVGGVVAGTTYYVYDIPNGTTFGISNTYQGSRRGLSSGSGSMSGAYVYVPAKAERDAGIIVDALAYDISHSGTYATTTAALAYFTSAGNAYVSGVYAYDITAFVGALTYLKTLVGNVLANNAPAQNYQTLNGVLLSNQAIQNIDTSLTAESGTTTGINNLVSIVTTGLTAGTTSAIPAVINPGTTISVKTGTYSEILPIVVPRNTAVVGDELRSSVVQPAQANNNLVNDKPKTIAVLNRIKSVIPNLLANTTVTPTAGNTAVQQYLNGFTGSTTAISRISTNAGIMNTILAGGLGSVPSFTLPTPTGGSYGYTSGYFNAARLILANKSFLQAEVTAYMVQNYSSLWTSLGSGGQANCTRDIGYEVDAINYDLMYGGNLQTVIAARSYYSNGTFVEASNEKTAALAVQSRLQAILSDIAQGNAITKTTGNAASQVTSGTAGSSAAGTYAVARVTEIYNTINTGYEPTTIAPDTSWVASDLTSAFAVIQSKKSLIQSGAIAAIGKQYPSLVYNTATCSRDVGYLVDALCYDFMFGSNQASAVSARAYYRATASAQVVINNQLTQTQYTVSYINTTLQHLAQGITGDTGSSAAVNSVVNSIATIKAILANGITTVPAFTFTNPTGYNTSFLSGYGDGKAQIVQNYQFIKDEISAYLNTNYNSVWVALGAGGQASCQRDVGYLLDALQYDMTYGGNTQSLIAGSAYFSNGSLTIQGTEKTATLAAYTRLQTIIGQIVQKQSVTPSAGNSTTQVTTGTAGSAGAATFAQARVGDTISWITNAVAPATVAPTAAIALSSTALQNGYNALQSYRTELQADTVSWVNKFYQSMNFNSTTCSRDAGYVVDALSYDLVFGTNFNSIKAGMAYYRATTSAQYVIANQLNAEIGAINFLGQKAKRIAAYGATAQLQTTIDDMILSIAGIVTTTATAMATNGNITVASTAGMYVGMPIQFNTNLGAIVGNQQYWILTIANGTTITITSTFGSATTLTVGVAASGTVTATAGGGYETCGTGTYNNVLSTINGAEILRANKTFLSSEASAYVAATYVATVTSSTASTGAYSTSTAHNFTVGDPVVFTGTTFGGVSTGITYYVLTVPSTSSFTLTATQFSGTPLSLSDATGSMTATYNFSSTACQRDMGTYIDALVADLVKLGNYNSMRAVTLYKNAVTGSLLSDMFYLRNSTGLRNMTTSGLTGTLSAANTYGTQRPTAGAYASLDPGYGPQDANVWISTRSPYVQNVTTFGSGCVGCKIDGALHAAGNRSIVANDFTQVLSDGIGVWCTGSSSLTELVSVFSYYNYAGYLAEYGGKIRATNGNNSYGTYGSLAEGVDTYEIPVTGTVNNRYYQAQIGYVLTNGVDTVTRLEYTNAGTNYNTATYSVSGTGYNVAVDTYRPEFRDNGVFEGRLLGNGANYVSISNVAQGGSATNITLAATDSAISAAYVGMRVIVTSGTGNGQTGYFLTYNSGTKLGVVAKESFAPLAVTAAGSNLLTVSSTATLYANMPIQFTGSILSGCTLSTGTTYYVVGSSITSTQFSVSASSGGVALSVGTSTGGGPMSIAAVGWDHIVTGTAIASFLDLTSAYIIEPRVTFSSPTFSATAGTQTSAAYADAVYGDTVVTYNGIGSVGVAATGGSGINATFTVVRSGVAYTVTSNATGTGYKYGDVLTIAGTNLGGTSTNNITVTVNNVNASTGAIQNFTYSGTGAGGYFVAIAPSTTSTYISANGTTWSAGGALTASPAWSSIAYGNGRWVAVATGSNVSNYTTDPTAAWSAGGNMPQSGNWSSITYGAGVFMAVQSGSNNAAYSVNGTTWFATSALPGSNATWTSVAYGNGTYVAIASGGTQAASSTDGQSWTSRTLPASTTWTSVTFGKGVFVAVASGGQISAHSKDGITWVQSTPGLPSSQTWAKVRYGAGVFYALASNSTSVAATSENGKDWLARTLTATQGWGAVAYGNPNSTPIWTVLGTSTTVANYLNLGCTAQGRVKVSNGAISEIRIVEPGSGYNVAPTMSLTDPNQTATASWQIRSGTGVLANPNFSNRGLQYATATATVTGNGYADMYQTGYYINIAGLLTQPTAGSNVQFALNNNYYKLVQVTNYLGTSGNGQGGSSPYTARFQLSPALNSSNAPAHGTAVTMRIKYSQVRLTGHDFLSIGTGGVTTTNYPNTPLQSPNVNNQTVGNGGGRVFYTATDQDGNFTVGTLFSVQQATGVASINADAFNLAGLNSLTLGSVALGGTGATVTQFSTDQYFTANSDNIVPTQKAIKAYIASQIGGGSSALNVNTLTAGVIYIAGNSISTTTGVQINVTATMNFTGGINGLPVAMDFLLLG
jgi:hypothetical protein